MIDMTVRAGSCYVLTRQFEDGQVMVEFGRSPAVGGVAGTTVSAEAPLVNIFFCVAGIAVFGCPLKNMINMAIRASDTGV
jgi:hypothetical protein